MESNLWIPQLRWGRTQQVITMSIKETGRCASNPKYHGPFEAETHGRNYDGIEL